MPTQRIYALFPDIADAERAIGAVKDHGVPSDAIGVAARRPAEQDEAARVRTDFTRISDQSGVSQGEPEATYTARPGAPAPAAITSTIAPTSTADTSENVAAVGKEGITTTTAQDAGAGASVGAGIGLVAGILLAAAALTIPGVGIIIGGGALAAGFGAAAATTAAGAIAGGVTGYLRDMGMPEHAAEHVADRINEGDYLVTIDVNADQYDDLKLLLEKYHAVGIDIGAPNTPDAPQPAAVDTPARPY